MGSNVWAKSFNGDFYRGQVTALADKVYIKFENGDTIAHDRYVDMKFLRRILSYINLPQ